MFILLHKRRLDKYYVIASLADFKTENDRTLETQSKITENEKEIPNSDKIFQRF